MSTESTLQLSLELIKNLNAFNGERAIPLLDEDFEQEIIPKCLGEFIPLRRNKTEMIAHVSDLQMAIPLLNVRTSVPSLRAMACRLIVSTRPR